MAWVNNEAFVSLGLHYGYPKCCIMEFALWFGQIDNSHKKLWGTGYVPCAQCNRKTEQQLIDAINLNRMCPYEFGYDVFA